MNRTVVSNLERFRKLDDLRTVGRLNEQQLQEYATLAAELAPTLLRQLEQAEEGLKGLAERLTAVEAASTEKTNTWQYTDKINEQQVLIDAQQRVIRQQQRKLNRLQSKLEAVQDKLTYVGNDEALGIPQEWQTPEGERYQVAQMFLDADINGIDDLGTS